MVDDSRVLGDRTNCMVRVFTLGPMAVAMKASIVMTRSMGSESTHGPMANNTRDSGSTASSTAKASSPTTRASHG